MVPLRDMTKLGLSVPSDTHPEVKAIFSLRIVIDKNIQIGLGSVDREFA